MTKNRKLIFIGAGLAMILLLAGAIALLSGGKQGPVQDLAADPCYAEMDLSWKSVPGADGYYIYAAESGKEFEKVGETDKDHTSFAYTDYKHDTPYDFQVSYYRKDSDGVHESEPSKTLTAKYDSSKYAQKIPVLTYHEFMPSDYDGDSSLLVKEDDFDKQMKYLHDNGYTTLTPDEFYEWHAGKKEFPVKTVMITMDDGFAGTYYIGYPTIKKYDMAATVFCIGKHVAGKIEEFQPYDTEKGHYVKQDVIAKVREEYPRFSFESHTYDMHNRVDGKVPATSFTYDQLMDDCNKNDEWGFTYLAYPWGSYGETIQKVLKDKGYKMAFAYRPFYYALRSDDTYAINRIKINGGMSMATFIKIVSGKDKDCDNPDAPENNAGK